MNFLSPLLFDVRFPSGCSGRGTFGRCGVVLISDRGQRRLQRRGVETISLLGNIVV